MEKIIISDTTCLIVLSKIGALDLLKTLFSTVTITPEIQKEYGNPLPDWIVIEAVIFYLKQNSKDIYKTYVH